MWRPITPLSNQQQAYTASFALLDQHADFFDAGEPVVVARAPGRLDLMGGIADYSGSLVLEMPLAVAATAFAQRAAEPSIAIRSLQAASIEALTEVTIPLAALAPTGAPLPYTQAQKVLAADARAQWAAYIAGTLVVLGHERGITIDCGMHILVDSQVPPGKGVSSSAAIEVAAMQVIAALYEIEIDGRDLAMLCQKVENLVVGAPCGVMDQMTSACGEAGTLLALRCQPAELEASVALPADLEVWGIDSGIRHAVSGADYGSVRVGAFMGRRMLQERERKRAEEGESGGESFGSPSPLLPPSPSSVLNSGYLANITPSEWETQYCDFVPEQMRGDQFLGHYGETGDPVTAVDPARTYAVRVPTAHPIYENHRVQLFRALLQTTNDERRTTNERQASQANSLIFGRSSFIQERNALLGELMFQSHASYSACGLGSDGTDRLVALVRTSGIELGLYGAKITGGGSGGTVAVLARRGAEAEVRSIAAQYQSETGRETTLLHGSSPGAKSWGVVWLRAAS